MNNPFFEKPILNSPYKYPSRHWELDATGQPTQKIMHSRRAASFITPIPKPRKRKGPADQTKMFVSELSTQEQEYDHTALINAVRREVGKWRRIPNPNHWRVTPETARLIQHWRHHDFAGYRPFFCQVEAVETAIWLTEVAPQMGKAERSFLEDLANANMDTYWVPGVNNLGPYGRWAFAEFTEVFRIESDFKEKVEAEFNRMIEKMSADQKMKDEMEV